MAYWLDLLFRGGIERVLVNTHHLSGCVTDFLAASRWARSVDTVHEPRLLGTAGTLRDNQTWFSQQPILLAHADNLTLFDVRAFWNSHQQRPNGCLMTMMTFETDAPHNCGIVETDSAGRVIAFHEKIADPPGNRANAAVYLIDPEVIDLIPGGRGEAADLSTEVIPALMGRIFAVPNTGYHRDIGTPSSLAKAQIEFPAALAAWHQRLKGDSSL
jgi:mannose-1-phosphate guanylyltransferase